MTNRAELQCAGVMGSRMPCEPGDLSQGGEGGEGGVGGSIPLKERGWIR